MALTISHLHRLVATAKSGDTLYCDQNFRVGGKDYRIERADGTVVNGNDYEPGRWGKPLAPPSGGRWTWINR